MKLTTQHNQPIILGELIGQGGEAQVFHVVDQPNLVAKCYHQPTARHEAKLIAMMANIPQQPPTHTAIVWPTNLLYQDRQFCGFLMPKVTDDQQPIFYAYNPIMRKKQFSGFSWSYLHRTALNLMIASAAIHAKGHIIGDINRMVATWPRQGMINRFNYGTLQLETLSMYLKEILTKLRRSLSLLMETL